MTIDEFIKQNSILIEVKKVDQNPNNKDWKDADHWQVTFKHGYTTEEHNAYGRKTTMTVYTDKKAFVTYFSKGSGHNGAKPTTAEVLDCLASDASSVENEDMDNWIESMGYSTEGIKEIRKAEKIYRTIQEQSNELQDFLGFDNYKMLLWDIERL